MAIWDGFIKTIDSCHSLFLDEISEIDGRLQLMLVEGIMNSKAESRNIAGVRFDNCHRVEPTSLSQRFQLTWSRYIAYVVTDECLGRPRVGELPDSGRFLRRYSKSDFLDYVAGSTIATEGYPGAFSQVTVFTENHIIDVASTEMPKFQILTAKR